MTSKPSFLATNYCVFCHEQFPLHLMSGPNAWQCVVRAGTLWDLKSILLLTDLTVLHLGIEGDGGIELTRPTYLPSNQSNVNVALSNRPRAKVVILSRALRVDQTCNCDDVAFCFHSWCYSVLKWVLKWEEEDRFIPVLYRLARALAPDPSLWEDISEGRRYLDSASRLNILACHEEQPLLMSRLPLELRTDIWSHTGMTTPYSAFLIVRVETSRLVSHLRPNSNRGLIQYRGPFLSTKMVSVFGTKYIQDLVEDRQPEGDQCSIRNATRVKYATSTGGLCAFQLLGIDWKSDWIGKIPSMDCAWYGIIRGQCLALRYDYNVSPCNVVDRVPTNVGRI